MNIILLMDKIQQTSWDDKHPRNWPGLYDYLKNCLGRFCPSTQQADRFWTLTRSHETTKNRIYQPAAHGWNTKTSDLKRLEPQNSAIWEMKELQVPAVEYRF